MFHDPWEHRVRILQNVKMTSTNLTLDEREHLKRTAVMLGATFKNELDVSCSLLVARRCIGAKYEFARKRPEKIAIVSEGWMWEVLIPHPRPLRLLSRVQRCAALTAHVLPVSPRRKTTRHVRLPPRLDARSLQHPARPSHALPLCLVLVLFSRSSAARARAVLCAAPSSLLLLLWPRFFLRGPRARSRDRGLARSVGGCVRRRARVGQRRGLQAAAAVKRRR
eukprot:1574109-Rhodomonas_salina.1